MAGNVRARVHKCARMCVCFSVCIHVSASVCKHMHVCACTSICVLCVRVQVHACVCVCVHLCLAYPRTSTRVNACMFLSVSLLRLCPCVSVCVCLRLCACVGVHATSMWESSSGIGSDPSPRTTQLGAGRRRHPEQALAHTGRLSEARPHTCAVLFSRGSESPVAVCVQRLGNLCWRLEQRCLRQVELQLPVTLRLAGGCPRRTVHTSPGARAGRQLQGAPQGPVH